MLINVFFYISRAEDGAQYSLDEVHESQGNAWVHWIATMPNRTDPYQVAIEAVVDDADQGDIGIDDVVFR